MILNENLAYQKREWLASLYYIYLEQDLRTAPVGAVSNRTYRVKSDINFLILRKSYDDTKNISVPLAYPCHFGRE